MNQKYRALGLMSGTSLDAIDVAMIETDGISDVLPLDFEAFPYDNIFRDQLRACFGKKTGRIDPHVAWAEDQLTQRHAHAVNAFLKRRNLTSESIDLIGFHGQTIWHDPTERETLQIGNGALLAEMTKITVVNNFRSADVKAGGQGAPLVPLYHQAIAKDLPKPLAIINIGGVANVTWIGGDGYNDILAFDLGPGNALLDDWILEKTKAKFDKDGALAAQGQIDQPFIDLFLLHPFFEDEPPKSLDRNAFLNFVPKHLSTEDGAATLTAMSVQAMVEGLMCTPEKPLTLYLTGGGRHNTTIRNKLFDALQIPIQNVDDLGWCGDALEAEAFAYLAVRSRRSLPLSLPTTTGVSMPTLGGETWEPKRC